MYEESRIAETVNAPKRAPQVAEALEVLEKTVEAHHELCAQMEQRLAGVLRSEPEAAENASQKEIPRTVVGLAQRVNEISNRLHSIGNSYTSILRRLEL